MELELGLALPNHDWKDKKSSCNKYGDRRFVDDEVESKDSSPLLWSGQPNEDDDHRKATEIHVDEVDDDDELVGWPPINSWRKEALHRHQGGWAADRVAAPARNSMFVKVKMAGVAIGRKIDLRRFNSYQALTHTLIDMFFKYTNNEMGNGDFTILYQDNEGDWLLAGDVPWEIFVESVHRIEIQRNAN